jgi:predicted site-specific integrase-resolvase
MQNVSIGDQVGLDLFREAEAAQMLRISPVTLARYRKAGQGPAVVKLGTRKGIFYQKSALLDFLADKTIG